MTKEQCFIGIPNMRYADVPAYHRKDAVANLIIAAVFMTAAIGLMWLADSRPDMPGFDRVFVGEVGGAFICATLIAPCFIEQAWTAAKKWYQAKKIWIEKALS